MRILLACDIDTSGGGNPYTLQLLHALEGHPSVDSVQHGASWMGVEEATFDIVHIQWPEALTSFNRHVDTRQFKRVKNALQRWSASSAIVTTVHNRHPHNSDSAIYRELYRSVYKHSDGVIHLGETSKVVLRERYAKELENTNETLIEHGNYAWFPNTLSKSKARTRLSIDPDARVILAFGSIRSSVETDILLQGFKDVVIPRKKLLIAGCRTRASKRTFTYYRQEAFMRLDPRIQSTEEFIPARDVQLYLKAADILVIPRLNTLNSGNVALGFTFGRVVVGPDYGVIGETLRARNNPVFDPTDSATWGRAMTSGIKTAISDQLGDENLDYARTALSWKMVGAQHVSFYERMLA